MHIKQTQRENTMKKYLLILFLIFCTIMTLGIDTTLLFAKESSTQNISSITIDGVPYDVNEGKARFQEGGLNIIVLPDESEEENGQSTSVVVYAFSDRKEAENFQADLFQQESVTGCPSYYKNTNFGGDFLTPCTDIPDTGVYGFANNISSVVSNYSRSTFYMNKNYSVIGYALQGFEIWSVFVPSYWDNNIESIDYLGAIG